jgi:hypothetical protein
MDIHRQDLGLQLSRLLLLGFRSLLVFLNIELSQQHDRFLPKDAAGNRVRFVDAGTVAALVMVMRVWILRVCVLRVDIEHPSRSTKPLVPTSKVDSTNAILAKH